MAGNSNWFIDNIWEKFSDWTEKLSSVWTKIKEIFEYLYKFFKWEVSETVNEAQEEIDKVATDLISEKLDITDEKISEEELKILEKIVKLEGGDQKIDNWLTWIKDGNSEELQTLVVKEEHWILSKLQIESNDEWNTDETDLNEEEFNMVAEFIGKKSKVCYDVFQLAQSDDEKFKDLSDKFKTKEEIVASCNKVLEKKGWDIDLVTADLIIDDLKKKQIDESWSWVA